MTSTLATVLRFGPGSIKNRQITAGITQIQQVSGLKDTTELRNKESFSQHTLFILLRCT